LVVSFPSDVAF